MFIVSASGPRRRACLVLLAGCCWELPTLCFAQNGAATAADDVIIVNGEVPPGSVIGDIPPENQIGHPDIEAYGVGTVNELLDAIAAQTQSGQGREDTGPVVLVNGKRVSGVDEVGDLPTEAVVRVDILPEEVALKYGYDAQRKVVNVILRRRFQSRVANLGGGFATTGQGENAGGDLSYTRIRDNNRTSIVGRVKRVSSLLESEREVAADATTAIDPTGAIADDTAYRTLRPRTRTYALNANIARQLSETVNLSINARGSHATSDALNGLPTGTLAIPGSGPYGTGADTSLERFLSTDPLRQEIRTDTLGTGATLNTDLSKRWKLSVIAGYAHSETRTGTDRGYDISALQAALDAGDPSVNPFGTLLASLLGTRQRDRATAFSDSGNASLLLTGKLFSLPAGDMGISLRAGGDFSEQRSSSVTADEVREETVRRSSQSAQVSIDLPITSRRRGILGEIGNLTANVNAAVTRVSDYDTLGTFGYGLNWTPRTGISVVASVNQDRSAPTLAQRGDPVVTTDNVRIYDLARGETAIVTRITGGNADLKADDRRVFKLGLLLRPVSTLSLSLNANYINSRTRNAIMNLTGVSAAVEDAFPERFLRDSDGTLVGVDSRPVNVERENREQLRWGINFTQVLRAPKRPTPPPGFVPSGMRVSDASPQAPQGSEQDAPPDFMPPFPGESEGGDREIVVNGRAETNEAFSLPPGMERPNGFSPPPGPPPDGFGPPPGEGRMPGGFGPPGGGRGGFPGGSDNGTRLQVSLYHNWIFRNDILLRRGGSTLDLLDGDSIGGGAQPRHEVQIDMGVTDNGIGLRLSGSWKSAARTAGDVAAATGDLRFSPLLTLDLRLFANLANRFRGQAWARGARVSLSVDNLFNQRQRVRDTNGVTPLAYQAAYLDPFGRTIILNIRRIF